METAPAPTTPTHQRWVAILAALDLRTELMLEEFLQRVAEDSDYPVGLVEPAEVRESGRTALRLLTQSFRTGQLAPELLAFADDFGVRRAQQGVPPESLIRAVRIDFDLVWPHLVAVCGPEDAVVLSAHAGQVANIVTVYTARTNAAYLAERVRLAHKELNLQQEFISRLFSRAGQEEEIIATVATALGVDAAAVFSVAAVPAGAVPELRQRAAARLRGPGCWVYDDGPVAIAFWQSGHPNSALRTPRAFLDQLVCGLVDNAHGLSAVPAAAGTARTLLSAATEADVGPLTTDSVWARVALVESQRAGVDLAADLEDRLSPCGEGERTRLRETLILYMANGSVVETSALLYCHRNTVLNRVRRFEELTGLRLSVPAEAARAAVALAGPSRRR